MLIGDTSKYYLKKVRAKAKLYEYHIPENLHGITEKEVNQLIISAIAIIGDFSDRIIDSFKGVDFSHTNYQENLQFASRFFDGFINSQLYSRDKDYYVLLGSIVYYLCDRNGSSRVLALQVGDNIDLGINGVDSFLTQILKGCSHIDILGAGLICIKKRQVFRIEDNKKWYLIISSKMYPQRDKEKFCIEHCSEQSIVLGCRNYTVTFCEQDHETGTLDGLAFCVSKIRGRGEDQIP